MEKSRIPSSRSKRLLPTPPSTPIKGAHVSEMKCSSAGSVLRSVTFSSDIIETSIGGTQTVGKIQSDPLSMSLSVDHGGMPLINVSSSICERKENIDPKDISMERSPKMQLGQINSSNKPHLWQKCNSESFLTPVKDHRRVTVEGHIELTPGESPVMRTPTRRYTLDEKLLNTPECYSAVQMDIPRFELSFDKDGSCSPEHDEDSSSVTVAVRVRPFMQRELSGPPGRCVVSMHNNETCVTTDTGTVHKFMYDFSFWSFDDKGDYAGQEQVYRLLAQPLLTKAFEGYNTCLFAYGQTGSGKSYSIMGHSNEAGIIPRFCEDLFSRAEVTRDSDKVKINVEISFFEIYNEKIHDLLASSKDKRGKKPTLKVREHPSLGPYVEGLSTYVTNSFEDVEGWINLGNKNRATAATGMNDKSSRSHSVFTLVLTQTRTEEIEGQEHDHSITSKINLVDLAGSERQSQAQTSGQRLREGANINKSLLTLGKVISSLSEQSLSMSGKKKSFIPYRDSVLTWLLKESLGGNSKTAMIATISPSHHHIEETLSTLRYANQARSIINIARVNEDPKAKIIRELRDEIDRLKGHSVYMTEETHVESLMEIAVLKDKLVAKEKEMEQIQRSWQQRLKKSETRKAEEAKQLEKAGIAFKVDNKLPNLVNLNEDPQLSEMLLYVINEGQTRVGRMSSSSEHEIQLNGALIADNHCIINNVDCVVSITPIGDAPTYINGDLITEPHILHHGDRVILGGDHYFRFNHPQEVRNKVSGPSQPQEMKDFDFAKQELLQVQESRLQAEVEEARRQAQEEVLQEVEKAKKEAEQEFISQKTGYEDKLAELEQVLKDQSQEVMKAEQSRQEANDVIQKLKKQKLMLEQEVIAGRRRQELEAKAVKKISEQTNGVERSKLLILLESEKQKVAQRIEELKQRRTEACSPTKRHLAADTQTGRADLYKVALLLREANKISQFLKKNMTFCREDYLEEGNRLKTLIKVTDDKLSLCTFWSVPKFEEKLMQMRDLYQSDADTSADDEVFHDPEDAWEHDEGMSPSRSPRSRCHSHKSSFLSRMNSVNSISSSRSLLSTSEFSVSSLSCVDQEIQTCSGLQTASLCKSLVLDHINKCTAFYFEQSIADKMLGCCEQVLQGVESMSIYSKQGDYRVTDLDENDNLQKTCVQLVTLLQSLTSHTALWSSMYSGQGLQSSVIHDLIQRLRDQVKVMSNHLVLLFQGLENDLDSLVEESSSKVKDTVLVVCHIIGELALATDTKMLSLDQMAEETDDNNLSADTCKAFISGCDSLMDKNFQMAVKTLEKLEAKTQSYTETSASKLTLGEVPQNTHILVSTCKLLVSKCQEVQVEFDTTLQEEEGDVLPPQFYGAAFKRSQSVVSHVSNLLETVSLLMQSLTPIIEGKDGDMRKVCRCAELIQKGAKKFLNSTITDHKNLKNSFHDDLSDISVLTDTQTENVEFAVQDVTLAAGSLIECAYKLVDLEKLTVTPRGKRLLPISPDKGPNSPIVHLRKTSLNRNIPLLGQKIKT